MKVYLSGGMKSSWQSFVIGDCDGFEFFDPRRHGLSDPHEYTIWDLEHVRQCDIVFAYMESTNPSGIGLTLEIGYAKALNKTIILVDEKSCVDSEFEKRFRIVRCSADIVFNTLEDGIEFLKSFSRNYFRRM